MKLYFLSFFFLISVAAFGQTVQVGLENVITKADAKKFIKDNPSLNPRLLYLNSIADTTELERQLLAKNEYDTATIGEYFFKIIEDTVTTFYHASYIYLDGTKLSPTKIDSLRKAIMTEYNNGVSFTDLFKQYNMDGNPKDGDLGWFREGTMVQEFDEALKKHKKDDVFFIDVPGRSWFYVAKETSEPRLGKALTLLMIHKVKGSQN